MLKNILKLEGAQKLTKNEQKSINGSGTGPCPPNTNFDVDTRLCRAKDTD
jgi:hypothetical protein